MSRGLAPDERRAAAVSTNAPLGATDDRDESQFRFETGYKVRRSIRKTARRKFSVSEFVMG
ncbi:hypothetical protein Sphch_1555 [Sphingobium chlorophenolicum L-1]|uniref:Uncharacterized protein n=1 Tax=Sphingobium chlorophenolicum L-1 TaxID=690566 RepID=F6EZ02_SPHCR|nr:hypothetical protein [Sphingobium chlorophenolicum]AEG49243.1 hypothetical protein Sphch_1555 [Sphingobium chlorophenolicum L-1]